MKMLAEREVLSRIKKLSDNEIPQIIELALKFSIFGVEKFATMLGLRLAVIVESESHSVYQYSNLIEASADTTKLDGQSSIVRTNGKR